MASGKRSSKKNGDGGKAAPTKVTTTTKKRSRSRSRARRTTETTRTVSVSSRSSSRSTSTVRTSTSVAAPTAVRSEPKKGKKSAYHVYLGDERSRLSGDKSTSFEQKMKDIGARWKALTPTEKQPYQDRADASNDQRDKDGKKADAKDGKKADAKDGKKADAKDGKKADAKDGKKADAKDGKKADAKDRRSSPVTKKPRKK